MTQLFPFLFAALTPNEAHAAWYFGNPVVTFRADRPAGDYVDGSVLLDKLRVHHCGGGYTDYEVDETIDPVAVNQVGIGAGNHCALTFYWASDLDIDGFGGLGAFTVRYSEPTTTLVLDADIDPVALTPYSVVSGSMSSGSPWLLANIE